MPYHAGALSEPDAVEVPATMLADPAALPAQLDACARLYGSAKPQVLGTVWWYSASSVLVAPAVEGLAATGVAFDPALAAIRLVQRADGRLIGARSSAVLAEDPDGERLGERLGGALASAIEAIAAGSGAAPAALWAIATDSIANRLLWAGNALGDVPRVTALASWVTEAIERYSGHRLPEPRYVEVAGQTFIRRASCCLIYQATAGDKCVSCPRQRPQDRQHRLVAAARRF
ncbi:(2Fe-2S)-binding protein [Tamaricihabitans halophyticus]|nr:(2Fe-2S)-binding protein [Tamaricihabitans halophyticus]